MPRGRRSEGAGVEMETADGSRRPLGGPFCAGPQPSSCCSDIRLSVGLSGAGWTVWSLFHSVVHSENKQNKQ